MTAAAIRSFHIDAGVAFGALLPTLAWWWAVRTATSWEAEATLLIWSPLPTLFLSFSMAAVVGVVRELVRPRRADVRERLIAGVVAAHFALGVGTAMHLISYHGNTSCLRGVSFVLEASRIIVVAPVAAVVWSALAPRQRSLRGGAVVFAACCLVDYVLLLTSWGDAHLMPVCHGK